MNKPINVQKLAIILTVVSIGWIIVLFIESSRPPLQVLTTMKGLDKLAHFLAFSILGLLVCSLHFNLSPKPVIPLFSMPLFVVILSGAFEECYQMFVPGRAASFWDWLADVSGTVCAIYLANGLAVIIRGNRQIQLS